MAPVGLIGVLAVVVTLAMAGEAPAATCSHQGGSGSWNNGLSWDCGHVPGPGDTAHVGDADAPSSARTRSPSPAR